jgi:acyl transferase domain-containing protein
VDLFDLEAFGIMRSEAVTMDPQQRLLIHTVHEALGGTPSAVSGRNVGAFVGIAATDYEALSQRCGVPISAFSFTAASPSVASGRLSYVFGLRGPTASVDTACSSSLVATHMAVLGFRYDQCQ